MANLIEVDRQAFEWVNSGLSNPVFDILMPYWRNAFFWGPLYVFLVALIVINMPRRSWIVFLGALLLVVICDQTSSHLIKPLVERPRPCHDIITSANIKLLIPCGGLWSFPSSHATNHFGLAVFLSIVLRKRIRWIWGLTFFWAFSVSFAQVYVGVHYPLDILAGAFLGGVIGFWIGLLTLFAEERIYPSQDVPSPH